MFLKLFFNLFTKPILDYKLKDFLVKLNEIGEQYDLHFWIRETQISPLSDTTFTIFFIVTYNLKNNPIRYSMAVHFKLQFQFLPSYYDFLINECITSLIQDIKELPDPTKRKIMDKDWDIFITTGNSKDIFNKIKDLEIKLFQ